MPFAGTWCKIWIYFGFVFALTKGARPRFDTSTDMGLVLVPADAEVDSVIFRLRATDQDADFPLVFEITATITPVVRIDNLPCTLYNKVCQANVILTKRLVAGRLHDFAVRVRDTKGDSNSMQATISVTNATTSRDKIFPHIPSLIMVPEDTKPGKELDYLLVRANSWSGKPVYIELWQPKELFTIRQRQTPTQTRGIITLIGELDFETQSVYTLTMYATDPYTEPGKDTRNIAGLNVAVVVTDVQDVPPIFTLAPPLTRINNSMQPGDIVLRVHAEDGDKGVPREIVYGLVSEGNPFTPFFNISEATGEIILARPLEELTQITHVGAPVVLTVVAEELRRTREEPPAQATVVDVGFLLGEPGNSPPYFESDKLVPDIEQFTNYAARIDENLEPGTVINFGEFSTKVKDEDIGKAGVFALKLENNNGTFEINPTVAERTVDFVVVVRDNTLIDYELYKALSFKIVAQEVGPATNLSTSVPVTIFLQDVNDNPPVFDEKSYEVTLSENVTAGSRVVQVHATDVDTGSYGEIRYTGITGEGSEAFTIDPDTGLITVAMGSSLDRETAERLLLTVEAHDENGSGNKGVAPLIVELLDVNDNAPVFDKEVYDFMLNPELTNFTSPAFIKAVDADAEPPSNVVKYELIHGNYENKFYLNETSGQLILRSPITKIRRKKQSAYDKFAKKDKGFVNNQKRNENEVLGIEERLLKSSPYKIHSDAVKNVMKRLKRASDDALFTLTARAYDLGIPHLSSITKIRIISGVTMEARIMMFVVPGEQLNSTKTAETLATITGGRVTVLETRPYIQQNQTGGTSTVPGGGKKSIIVARVEQTEPGTPLVDVEKIRETLAANGVGIIGSGETVTTVGANEVKTPANATPKPNDGQTTVINNTITHVQSEEVTVYKAENKLLFWLLIILGLLMLLAIAALIICCICPGCPFYMAPRKRRVHSSETLVARTDGRPKRHLHRQPAAPFEVSWNGRKQAWSADPTRRHWQFNKRNVKNCSLPGDVAFISGQPNDVHLNAEIPRLRDTSYDHSRRSRMDEQERMYMEEVDGHRTRGYDPAELDSLQRHEMERGSDVQRQGYRQRYVEPDMNGGSAVREQHFYREGNAEVLRLVTRGQMEDVTSHHYHHHPTTLIVDGKDIILQRFIEDQKSRHELSMQDIETARVVDQRTKETCQPQPPEIILIPDRLDLGTRQHVEEIGPNVQRLVIDHGDLGSQKMEKDSQIRETLRPERQLDGVAVGVTERPTVITKDHVDANKVQYSLSELELARQKTLLARLLLKREHRHAEGGIADSASYLETQSLPGQVAIATQTDRTTATQTERQVRSRSDNDESDEDSRYRKKLKSRKKYGEGDWRKTRTLWMKSPIEEEASPRFDKRLNILRKKVREVKEDRKISLEPEVLREISDSLDGNGSSYKGEEDESVQTYRKSTEQTSISYKILNEKENGSSCSMEMRKTKPEKNFSDKNSEDTSDYQKVNGTESTSSPEIKMKKEKQSKEKSEEKSPRKEVKSKTQKKSEGMIKPSFKILEKEFTMLTKKLSKLGDKKFQESTGSDSTSQEKLESKDPKKDQDQKSSKKSDVSQKQVTDSTSSASKTEQKEKQKKNAAIAKTKQKLKYQQTHVMSTGSSEYDDVFDKTKKQCGSRQENIKQKQTVSSQIHGKVKRQMQVDRREAKRQMTEFREEEMERRKDGSTKETLKTDCKAEKTGKGTRAPKLAIPRRDNATEETTTSTNSDHADARKDAFALSTFEKKDSTDSSGKDLGGVHKQGKKTNREMMERFSDDFVEDEAMGNLGQETSYEKTKQENVENMSSEEKSGVDAKTRTKENELKGVKHSVEKRVETEEKVEEKGRSTTTLTEDEVFRDVAQRVITSSMVSDIIESKEKKESSTSETKIMIMQETKEFKKEGEILLDVLAATQTNGKKEVTVDERKEEMITKDEEEMTQVVERKSRSSTEKDKSSEDEKKQIYKVKDTQKDHTPKREILHKIQKQDKIEKWSFDDEKKAMPMIEKEIKEEMKHQLKKQDQIPLSPDNSKSDTEVKHIIKPENGKEKIEEKSKPKMQINDKIDIVQKTEASVKEDVKHKLSSDEKDSNKEDKTDESKSFIENEKLDTIRSITIDAKEENVSIQAIRSPPMREKIISEIGEHPIEENIFLSKEEKSEDDERETTLKPQSEINGDKIKEEADEVPEEKFVPVNKEVPHQEGKTAPEIKIDRDEIKEKEAVFSEVSHERKSVSRISPQQEDDTLLDKEKKILADATTEDNQMDAQNVSSGTERLSQDKEKVLLQEIKATDLEISEKGSIFLDKEKDKTEIAKVETLHKSEEEDHDKEKGIATKMETVDDQQDKKKESGSTEISKVEDSHSISEKKDDSSIAEHSDTFQEEPVSKIFDDSKDKKIINQEKESFLETSTIHEQDTKEDKTLTKIPTPPDHSIKKEILPEEDKTKNQDSKKEGALSEMFKAVNSLADKLSSIGSSSGSGSISSEKKLGTTKPEDKIVEKEAPSLSTDNKEQVHVKILDITEPSSSSIEDQLEQNLKQVEEKVITEHTKKVAEEKTTPEGEKVHKTVEKDSEIPTIKEPEDERMKFKYREREVQEKRSASPEDGKMTIEWKEMIEKDLKIDVIVQPEDKEAGIQVASKEFKRKPPTSSTEETIIIPSEEAVGKYEKSDRTSETKELMEKEEIPKVSEEQTKITTQKVDENEDHKPSDGKQTSPKKSEKERNALQVKAEELVEKVLEESIKPTELHVESTDEKLEQTSETEFHEPPIEVSDSSPRTELPGTSVTSGATKEKFAFDSIAPETPADSRKIVEPEERLESESRQTGLREAKRSVEKQTSAATGDETQSFLERRPLREQDFPMISPGESRTGDTVEGTTDEVLALEDFTRGEREPFGEEYPDVSLPIFTSVIRTVDDSDDSDSSSDVSRKTTLTTRPYQTPRHRARLSPDRDNVQAVEDTDIGNIEDGEEELAVELVEDKDGTSSEDLQRLKDIEDEEKLSETVSITAVEDEDTAPKKETRRPEDLGAIIQIASSAEGHGTKQSSSKSSSKSDKSSKEDSPSAPQSRGSHKPTERRAKESDRKRIPPQRKKKSTSEESSEEKAVHLRDHGRYRPRKKPVEAQPKQKDTDQARQPRKTEGHPRKQSITRPKPDRDKKVSSGEKQIAPLKTGEIDTSKAQPKYMAWYKKNREEMEKRRAELRATDDEEQLPRWLRRSMRIQKSEDKKKSEQQSADTPRTRRKVKPLVNVESEQLKAIVRQGRKLRKAEGGKDEDPPVQIFATSPPVQPLTDTKHHLVQHSEYKYEKIPAPFYLHPPPVPHPSPQMSPDRFDVPPAMKHGQEEDFDSGIAISLQGGNRLRHQQLLEKKSVFDIAYSEAAPPQLRADSTTPPS